MACAEVMASHQHDHTTSSKEFVAALRAPLTQKQTVLLINVDAELDNVSPPLNRYVFQLRALLAIHLYCSIYSSYST